MLKRPEDQTVVEWYAAHAGDRTSPNAAPTRSVSNASILEEDPEAGAVYEHAWIPEGGYYAQYLRHELVENFKGYGDKLVVEFCIVEGDCKGEVIPAYFGTQIKGRYKYTFKGGSRWVTEMRSMFPERGRKESLPVTLLKGKVIEIQVRNSKGKGQKLLPENMRWSVVGKMIRVVR